MGVGVAAAIAGAALIAGGTGMSASAANKKLKRFNEAEDMWLPLEASNYDQQYFDALNFRTPQAIQLADTLGQAELDRTLRFREQSLPGIGKALAGGTDALAPLLRGELPQSVMDAYTRAGGASTVGSGFGGSGYGFLNTGLFGARGALGAMQTGFSLLPSLMSTIPSINSPNSASFLQAIMTPYQRYQNALQFRQQQIGIRGAAAGMKTGNEVTGGAMQQVGGILLGGAMGGGMGGMGGAGVMSTGYGPTGNWATPTTESYSGLSGANRLF